MPPAALCVPATHWGSFPIAEFLWDAQHHSLGPLGAACWEVMHHSITLPTGHGAPVWLDTLWALFQKGYKRNCQKSRLFVLFRQNFLPRFTIDLFETFSQYYTKLIWINTWDNVRPTLRSFGHSNEEHACCSTQRLPANTQLVSHSADCHWFSALLVNSHFSAFTATHNCNLTYGITFRVSSNSHDSSSFFIP